MKNSSKRASDASKFLALPYKDQWLLVYVTVVLTVYKCLLRMFPFNQFIHPTHTGIGQKKVSSEIKRNRVVWAIQLISSRTPFGCTCLVQALAAKWLLKHDPDVRVHIGVHKSDTQGFSAHAWVSCNEKTILGEQPDQVFKPILDWN
ncbi:lasso peptide biosynthesis B2 protein [Spirosoma aerophilum]